VTDADLVLGRLDPASFWGGRLTLDEAAARDAIALLGKELFLLGEASVEETAAAVSAIIDAHMTDAIRRQLSLAGADPRRLDLVAFGGMGAVHATTQAAALGMQRVLVPRAAPGFSALGLLSADHVLDLARTYVADWRLVDIDRLDSLAAELEASARAELEVAGVPDDRIRLEWMINMVYPGQTFDTSIAVDRAGGRITQAALEASVETFHRRNEEARLIEARSQEPMVRGVRLNAVGLVDRPEFVEREPGTDVEPVAHRRVFTGGDWHENVPVFDGETLPVGPEIHGPAIVQSRFTTLVLRPADVAVVQPNGDTIVRVGAADRV